MYRLRMLNKMLVLIFLLLQGFLSWSECLINNEEIRNPAEQQVMYAFSADLSQDTPQSDGSTIVFDRIITNVGGMYVDNSGQFVCPDDGLYVFIWNIQKNSNSVEDMQCITGLRQGGTDRKYGPKTSYYSTTYSGNTEMMTVLQCTLLTAVTVVSLSWSDTELGSIFRSDRTIFSGFKLQSPTAFTVELSKERNVIDGSRVMFDSVLHDYSANYDSICGGFKCPDDGVYVFGVSSATTNPNAPWSVSRLMKDGELIVQGPITYRATTSHDSGSNAINAVVQCSTGQSIYVETQASYNFLYNSYAPRLTSFTGFKLYNTTDPNAVAFTALMTSNQTVTLEGQTFIFDEVITNFGNAFDPSLSSFICPDNDYYLFTWSSTADYGSGSNGMFLNMENVNIKHSFLTSQSTSDETGTSGTGTITLIKQCATGSKIQLRAREVNPRVYLAGHCMFSGYKIPGELP